MAKSSITYYPTLSLEENAKRNCVSVYAIRKYIERNNIDRKRDIQMSRYLRIKKCIEKHPDLSLLQIAKKCSVSLNTVKKYSSIDIDKLSKSPTNKVGVFDTKSNSTTIRSVSNSQEEILGNIIKLYIPKGEFDCDLTTSKGVFYQKHIPLPKNLFDKYPQMEGVQPLEKAQQLSSEIFGSIVIDLPFIVSYGEWKGGIVKERFTHFESAKELFDANDYMLSLAHRLLCKGGILVMKTMDVNANGKQLWVSHYVQTKAAELGFKHIDTFIYISPHRILSRQNVIQRIARKYHSYFFVFKKI